MTLTANERCPDLGNGRPLLAFALLGIAMGIQLAASAAVTPAIQEVARPLPLSAVRLTGGPLKHAQDLNAAYLLELEPHRMLAGYRLRAGLEPKAEGYGGWDSVNGKQLTGHIAGHYLSAISLMFAATGDPRFRERADLIVRELKEVQNRRGTGYLGALTDPQGRDAAEIFEEVAGGNIRSGGFDLNGMWSPWYTLHKTYAGLRDAYRFTGNRTALEVETRFAAWAERILSGLTDTQVQRMLNTEFGGMNEIAVDLYADTGDRRWLDLSWRFEHRSFIEPLQRHQDDLAGKHGNTQVPKLLGSLARYTLTGDTGDGFAAGFFWDRVVQHHSFATGGHGKDEYFGPPDQLNDRVDGRTAESCNVYNLLKYTRRLFALRPDAHYADFLERALFNHVLASIDPEDGRTCYMVPVGRGVQHEYQDMFRSFTCCVGSGMESHALHGDGIYYESNDTLWVNLYVPSTVDWQNAKGQLTVDTDFPEGETATLRLTLRQPRAFTLALRRPPWVGEEFAITINGNPLDPALLAAPASDGGGGRRLPGRPAPPADGSYVRLTRDWQDGDVVSLRLPKTLRLEPLPDNPRRAAILWGPLVLAGNLGPEEEGRGRRRQRQATTPEPPPVFVAAERPVADWLKPVDGQPGAFRTDGVGREQDADLAPFYRLHRRRYAVYWDLYTPAEWEVRSAEIAAERERQAALEEATVAFVQPGEMQPERDFNQQGEDSSPVRIMGRPGRRAGKWFSFDVPVDSAHPLALVVTYNADEWRTRTFRILVDGEFLADQTIEERGPMRFFDVHYPIPAALIRDKDRVTIRFEGTQGREVAAVFGLRLIRTHPTPNLPSSPSVTAPPEAFFEWVPEPDREAARAFYRKYTEADGLPVAAAAEVADEALLRTREIVTHMLGGRPDVLRAMVTNRMYLIIIGKDQVYTDMPEYRNHPNPDFQNERVRGTGGRPTSFGEENLLSLPLDRYDDESIAVHEFAHTIDSTLRSIDPTWRERRNQAYRQALDRGLWRDTYAASNPAEHWAEAVQAYFDCNRVNNWNHGPVANREQLRLYDPETYELVRNTFHLTPEQDWRYTFLQGHPVVIPPPERFQFDPYYTRFTWAREFPILGRDASEAALLKANDTVRKLFAYRHDLLKALIADGVRLVVLGRQEPLARLPEIQRAEADPALDRLARTLSYSPRLKLLVASEENVLADPRDAGVGANEVVRVLADAAFQVTARRPADPNWDRRGRDVQQYELRVQRLDERFGARVDALVQEARGTGRWSGTTALHSPAAYWVAGVLAYFDAQGQDATPPGATQPITTREALRTYDPALYDLVHETMAYGGRVDWRYAPARQPDCQTAERER